MLEIARTPENLTVRTANLTVRFELVGDRWQHSIGFTDKGQWQLASVEGSPEDTTPPSPAFQDLWFEELSDSSCEFQLMGQAGAAIYSAAIRLDATAQRVEFDVCAKRKRTGTPIGATSVYQWIPGDAERPLPSPDHWEIETLSVPGQVPSTPAGGMRVDAPRIVLGPVSAGDDGTDLSSRQTRWRYRIGRRPQA